MKNQTFSENLYAFPTPLPKELTTYQTTIALHLLAALLVVIRNPIYIQILGKNNNTTTA